MGTSEVDTDRRTHTATVVQVEMRFSLTSDQGISQYPDNQQPQPPLVQVTLHHESLNYQQSKFHRHSFTNARIVYSRLHAHFKWELVK